MQSDIKKIVEWCGTCSMELSPEKCKAMHLGKQSSPDFIAGNKLSVLVSSYKNKSTLSYQKLTWFSD